jgi:hypothetical protein
MIEQLPMLIVGALFAIGVFVYDRFIYKPDEEKPAA